MAKKLEEQLNFIFERLGYHPARREMNAYFGRSFSKSKNDMFDDIGALLSADARHSNFLRLTGGTCIHLGNRHVELYSVKDPVRKNSLESFFTNASLSNHKELTAQYPFPIMEQDVLARIKKNQVHLMDKGSIDIEGETFSFAVFSTVTEHEIEQDGTAYLNQSGMQLIQKSNVHFYYVSKEYRQLFHVLYWNAAQETAILSIDKNLLSLQRSRDQLFLTKNYIEQRAIGALGKPLNVFDAIEPLYNSPQGKIVRLGHVTSDGNPVRLKLTRGQICLKQDKYHEIGESNGFVHAKFALGKSWTFGAVDRRSDVEVHLAGKAAMLDTAQPLSDFEIVKCARLEDLRFAIENIRKYAS
ncbi:TPA: hypothetical protein ACGUMO_000848 [Vibrio vulnificus]